jgi:hypothetical protein
MAKFKKYEKQALDLHNKKKEEREENEKKRKDRLVQKRKEEEVLTAKTEATITELTDDEALQLQKEIEKVCVTFVIIVLIYSFNLFIQMQLAAALSDMKVASVSDLLCTSVCGMCGDKYLCFFFL